MLRYVQEQIAGGSEVRRGLPAILLCVTVACGAGPALGDTYDENGRIVASLHVTQDESSGETDYAALTLFDQTQGNPGGGWLSATCTNWDSTPRPTAEARLVVQTPQRSQSGDTETFSSSVDTETFRVRIDRDAPHQWDADTRKINGPALEELPADFMASGDVPEQLARGLIAELAAGKRMIAQIGDMPVVTLDLDATKPDIVEFSNACERMWRDFVRSPRSAARIAFENIDAFTDEGRVRMELFHQTSHENGPQPRVFVTCGNDEEGHGVDVQFVPSNRNRGSVPADSTGAIRLRVESGEVRELGLLATKCEDSFRIDLLPEEALALVDRLATARGMRLDYTDSPRLRFDVAKGRPVIVDFRAKCRTVSATASSP